MPSIFTKIINGEIPCHKIAEDDNNFAFLDVQPLVMGHVLCVTKLEIDYIFHHEDAQLQSLILFSKKVALAIEQAVPCKRIGISVIGLEVPHTHIHLVPLQHIDNINFGNPKLNPSHDELAEMAHNIRKYIL